MDLMPGRPDSATAWLDAGDVRGLQVGSHNTQHNQFGYEPPVVRSAYLEQVRRIVPPELKDRDAELAELAAFCAGDPEYAYAWWRAPAWAGKSALMSWFALHPPPGVRIISFFVTGRHHRQNDRKAFVDNVLEQLAELLERRSLPAGLTDSTQDAHLAGMLAEAAAASRRAGERLVLLVDGLDEDRGVTAGPESYSIAATLPCHPPAGLSIVVSRRLDPPLPPDVPPDHPLRGRCRLWELKQSAHAKVVRADAERELKRILHAGGVEQDILSLVTAARGSLSIRDLAELTNEHEWLVEDYLSSYTGRTFARADAAYILAHEELQSTAMRLLGPSHLRTHRQRLHDWADRYRDRGWPLETPDYILRGYFRMLSEEGDTARLVRYATDAERHDRMLDHTGGDADALEEVTLAQEALLAKADPDLPSMCKLALRREDLEGRNRSVPLALPRLWAAVGNIARAEALVRSIPKDGSRRDVALILLAPEVAEAGHHSRAELLTGLIPANVFVDTDQPSKTICEVVRKIARSGDHGRATALAEGIDAPYWQSRAHCEIAVALALKDGSLAEAEAYALGIPMPYWRAQALAVLASKAANREQNDLAERLARSSESNASTLPDGSDRALVYAFLAKEFESWGGVRARPMAALATTEAAASADQFRQVEILTKIIPCLVKVLDRVELANLARLAESTLRTAQDENRFPADHRAHRLLGATALAWYAAGDLDHAAEIARSIVNRFDRESALLGVVGAAAAAGDLSHARALADSLPDPDLKDRAIGRIVANLADESGEEHLADLVNSIRKRSERGAALTDWGYRAAKHGDLNAAIDLADRADAISRSTGDPVAISRLLTPLVSALVAAGETKRAQAAARRAAAAYRSTPEQLRSGSALATLVQAAAQAGDYETAADAAQLIEEPSKRAMAQAQLASSIAQQGGRGMAMSLLEAAEAAAMAIPRQYQRLETLRMILTVLWSIGEDEHADALACRMTEREVSEPPRSAEPPVRPSFPRDGESPSSLAAKKRDQALAEAVEVVAAAGDFARADTLGDLIADERLRAEARTSVVLALARAGQHDHAYVRARSASDSRNRDQGLRQLAQVLAEQGALEVAEDVARTIENDFIRSQGLIALARLVEPARAQRLLLVPVRDGRLPDIVDLVADVCPQAVDTIADHLLIEQDREQSPRIL
ncbi:hypothetical protein [Micromonospora sp. NPDC003776]